jgi:hypothetical protein
VNILHQVSATGDSPLRSITPIITQEYLNKINELIRIEEEKEAEQLKKRNLKLKQVQENIYKKISDF